MGDRSGEWAGQGNTEYFLFSKVFLDHVGPMWSCPILLEEHSPVVLEEEIDRPYKLLFHNLLIRGTVNPLWEAAGVISMLHSPLLCPNTALLPYHIPFPPYIGIKVSSFLPVFGGLLAPPPHFDGVLRVLFWTNFLGGDLVFEDRILLPFWILLVFHPLPLGGIKLYSPAGSASLFLVFCLLLSRLACRQISTFCDFC